ncbi:MAG: hypothetical protein JXB07_11270 [Anaerolineae bacterium]|nr:hypothetical protein [Anaerolineae bacterium]
MKDRENISHEIETALRQGNAPAGLVIDGHLDLTGQNGPKYLPEGLSAISLDLSGSPIETLPTDLKVRRLDLSGCNKLKALPAGFKCYDLAMCETGIQSLPPDLQVEYRLDLTGSTRLERLPEGLAVGTLILRNCRKLRALPEGLEVNFLDISGCTRLKQWPERASVSLGWLNAGDCTQITSLPGWLTDLSQLNVQNCAGLTELPSTLRINSWIDIAGSGIQSLPDSLQGVQIHWRGIPVSERVAFHPETLTGQEILDEPNAELRRVLLERMGYEAFLKQVEAETLDEDVDAGGIRKLFRVSIPDDEDLVCVSVICPSTARHYILRVPPTMTTCRQAIAWTAGFDDAEHYKPIYES